MTNMERIRALKSSLKSHSWNDNGHYRLEKEDAAALWEYLENSILVDKGKKYNAVSYRLVKSIYREKK